MEKTLAVITVIVKNYDSVEKVNALLHTAGEYIVGRMGIPYRERDLSVINVILDAPKEIISALSGKLGMINGIKCQVLTTK
ncbi:MAG: iron-only hydrogenase system regulator [Clostridia bacterium]|nr:iron-only hydrogenase system regulator [Clostridia bacterium]